MSCGFFSWFGERVFETVTSGLFLHVYLCFVGEEFKVFEKIE